MTFAVVLALLVIGSVLFHVFSPWYLTPLASNWSTIDDTLSLTFWVTGVVFVAINMFMAYCVFRYRHRPGNQAHYEPENKKIERWLIGLTTIGVAAMLAPGLKVWADFVTVPEEAAVVEAVGQQWQWSFRFPGRDGELGAVDAKKINEANPFGMDPDDANGQDDILIASPDVHLPLGKPVKVLLRSKDVLHNFSVAQIRVKMDLVPGIVTFFWFTPTKTGTYDILCEEYCGLAHFAMRGRLIVDEATAFEAWLASQPTYAQMAARTIGDAAAGQPLYAVCSACHGAQGEGNLALNAPKLAGQADWYLKRQLKSFKQGTRGQHAEDIFGQQMAPMAATLVDDAAIDNVIAHINTLSDTVPKTTVQGDVVRGRSLYRTCSVCHGPDGLGVAAANAPRQARMSDWYLVRQLNNFKQGIRGAHPDDMYGEQMGLIAKSLSDEHAVADLVAYINTL